MLLFTFDQCAEIDHFSWPQVTSNDLFFVFRTLRIEVWLSVLGVGGAVFLMLLLAASVHTPPQRHPDAMTDATAVAGTAIHASRLRPDAATAAYPHRRHNNTVIGTIVAAISAAVPCSCRRRPILDSRAVLREVWFSVRMVLSQSECVSFCVTRN